MSVRTATHATRVVGSTTPARRGQIFRGHIVEFDGLRAYGSLLVILAHFWVKSNVKLVADVLSTASIAMDSFFVLSGFLITGILLDSKAKPTYYRSYYVRRSLRIFPLYYLVLVLAIAASLVVSGATYLGTFSWFALYLGNIPTAITGAWPKAMALTPLWSLQIEEQFYLLYPLLVKKLSTAALTRFLWALVFISPLLRTVLYFYQPSNEYLQYVLLPCRMDGLALGSLIAIRFRRGPWQLNRLWIGALAAIVLLASGSFAALHGWSSGLARTAGYSFSSLGCALLVLFLIQYRDSNLTSPLRWAPVAYIGKISYGIYVFQLPVSIAFERLVTKFHWGIKPGTFPGISLPILLTVAVASVSWFFFEQPILALKNRFA